MQSDFHYYATYCAAIIAGYSHEESLELCYSDQFVDKCSKTLLSKVRAPLAAATTQLGVELVDARTDILGLQDTTRIWASFHFLPQDLYAVPPKRCSKRYRRKYRMICGPNGDLVVETVNLAKGSSLAAAGIAMHVLSDTWAHRYFAGTPSLVINNTNYHFYELVDDTLCQEDGKAQGGRERQETRESADDRQTRSNPEPSGNLVWRRVRFGFNPLEPDDPNRGVYINSPYQVGEHSVSNLGHGRAGHLPDYSFITYRYMPAWADYEEVVKDNSREYLCAFTQMIHAMKYLRGECDSFQKDCYDMAAIEPWEDRIRSILAKRQLDASDDWKAFGEELSGCTIEDFDVEKCQEEYLAADDEEKDSTFLGQFVLGAMAQKSMVTNRIRRSGSMIAGHSIDFKLNSYMGIRDFQMLAEELSEEVRGVQVDD